jgi:hypothetical protein
MSGEAATSLLFVDYENVGKALDLNAIPEGVRVLIFIGALQKSVPTELMRVAHRLGPRFVPIDIEGQGKNALDFHVAYYLGEHLAANPQADCIVLSKDKGFDLLIKHLKQRGFKVRRADSMTHAFPSAVPKAVAKKPTPTPKDGSSRSTSPLDQAIDWLRSMQARARPRKRTGLIAHLRNRFKQNLPENQIEPLVDAMIAKKVISEADGKLAYNL